MTTGIPMIIPTDIVTIMTTDALTPEQFQRLQTWFGTSFPIGAFSYSHGLESAFESGLVTDRATLADWIEGLLLFGSARNDAILFCAAHSTFPDFAEVAELSAAISPSMELRAETLNQGEAFLKAVAQGWPNLCLNKIPDRGPDSVRDESRDQVAKRNVAPTHRSAASDDALSFGGSIALPVASGACCAAASIPLKPALLAYLHGFAANIVSAALRSMPVGQSIGLSVQASLESTVAVAVDQALIASLDEIGSATPMLDWLSATHETQYSRLFRS